MREGTRVCMHGGWPLGSGQWQQRVGDGNSRPTQPCWRRDRGSPGDRESCQGRHEGPDVQFLESHTLNGAGGTSCVTAMRGGHEAPGRWRASGHDRPHTDNVP